MKKTKTSAIKPELCNRNIYYIIRVKLLIALLITIPSLVFSQDCNCKTDFEWVKTTFENNDAGYQYIIETKGEQAYEAHNIASLEKISTIKNATKCQNAINEWLFFFRKGHIGLQYLGEASNDSKEESNPDWETYSFDINDFKSYLDKKTGLNYEGIWKTGPYEIGIKQEGDQYIGFIISSETASWKREQVKLKFSLNESKAKSTFYLLNHSSEESNTISLYGKNNMQIGDIFLKREYPIINEEAPQNINFRALTSETPFIEQLNKNTLYFRIPSFTGTPEKTAIDSVITTNREKILSTKNLIIDIRYGTGGSDNSYSELLPILYTNPIRTPGMELLSTPTNNQRLLDFASNTGMAIQFKMQFTEDQQKEFKSQYDLMSKHIGKFVDLDSTSVNITTFDTIYPFPKNIGIIHNNKNGSTDEQFLLAAKQSKKVKLFGRTTMGALDFSNMNMTISPCGNYALWYTLSRSSRIPEMAIDGKGIQPDYYIDSEIPEPEWIEYVSKTLSTD